MNKQKLVKFMKTLSFEEIMKLKLWYHGKEKDGDIVLYEITPFGEEWVFGKWGVTAKLGDPLPVLDIDKIMEIINET